MSKLNAAAQALVQSALKNGEVWGLQDSQGDGWLISDSIEFDGADCMPIWSSESAANALCKDEWQDYRAVKISVDDLLGLWIEDLNQDGILLGIDWQDNEEDSEIDPIVLAKALVS